MAITPEKLFAYASTYAKKSDADGRNRIYPTLREVAARFKVNHDAIESACEDWDQSKGYMGIVVGVMSGGGVATFKHRGDCQVEAYH